MYRYVPVHTGTYYGTGFQMRVAAQPGRSTAGSPHSKVAAPHSRVAAQPGRRFRFRPQSPGPGLDPPFKILNFQEHVPVVPVQKSVPVPRFLYPQKRSCGAPEKPLGELSNLSRDVQSLFTPFKNYFRTGNKNK